ncbi:MAG TPA: class I adenylate-forming enzyme family protein [Pseudonocardia sp.]|jgi:acyl-CoA synthetase (AMP-forming)/AMP-acid ligase II|nr:class I adenylate-forming enzyme family protein [Pseudonocardia sp.]
MTIHEAAPTALVAQAAGSTVDALFDARVQAHPTRTAIQSGPHQLTYRDLQRRSRTLATVLADLGIRRGTTLAVLSENRTEYLEIILAAARLGAVVACQSTRSSDAELEAGLELVEPQLTICSPRLHERFGPVLRAQSEQVLVMGVRYEQALASATPWASAAQASPEDILVIIYTSGTTGRPKGACISHRAEIARSMSTRAELGLAADATFVAWSPLSHMGALDNSLSTLISGGTVVVVDGFDPAQIASIVATQRLGWLLIMPGTTSRLVDALRAEPAEPAGVTICGVMPDLIPAEEIAELTTLLDAPFANTFGSTETGCPPCSANAIPVGHTPTELPKEQSAFCEVRLVDPDDFDVPPGSPGEICLRGPTLFSGYWNDPEATAEDFRGGWFHMGDVFVRRADGTLDFVDRVKYLIKSGGENVYPAEIERVLLRDPRVLEAAVVRRTDPVWGEIPVAFVTRSTDSVSSAVLAEVCAQSLPRHKRPKAIHFVPAGSMPRNASGKIVRQELEKLAAAW